MRNVAAILALFFLGAFPAWGACHTVSISGSGTKSGADWNNTMQNLPTTMVRGDTYFLADGTGYVVNGLAAASGPIVTYMEKAVPTSVTGSALTAHCTDTGWSNATYGSSQAIFTGNPAITMYGFQYFTVDGQTRTTLTTGYGIKIDTSACNTNCYTIALGYNGTAKASNILVNHVEFQQSNQNGTTNFQQDYGIYAYNNDGGSPNNGALNDITVENSYFANSACDFIFTRGVTNFTVQYSYFYRNNGGSSCHGQNWEDNNSTNLIARYNVFNESRGTAVIVVLCDICSGTTIPTNGFYVYGNVFYDAPGGSGWTANGTVACLGPSISCSNMYVYNNTIANLQNVGAGAGSNTTGVEVGSSAVASPVCENNLWYNINADMNWNNSCSTEDYNTFVFSSSMSGFTGAHDLVVATNINDFTNSSQAAPTAADFTLTKNATPDYGTWTTLSAPYAQSCGQLGCTSLISRTANRGAYEFNGGSTPADAPTFSPPAGTYSGTQIVTISTLAGGVICWNTTGSPATDGISGCAPGSTLYTGPVTVSSSETLYGVAGGTGYTDSSVSSAAYTITGVGAMRGCDMSNACN